MKKLPNSSQQFMTWVQDVLNHLYDSSYLQQHPLVARLCNEMDELRRVQEVRRILLDAIRATRPGPGVPAQSPDWRAYRLLHLRYIEGLGPNDVMDQLGLSKSHYFREQARIVGSVASRLWRLYGEKLLQTEEGATDETPVVEENTENVSREQLVQIEVERLCAHAKWQEVDIAEVLQELRPIVVSLARVKQIAVDFALSPAFCIPHGEPGLLRQAVLNVVSYGLDIAGAVMAQLRCFSDEREQGVLVTIRCRERGGQGGVETITHRRGIGLEVCSRLMAAMQGHLEIHPLQNGEWVACLVWRQGRWPVLLVIDDNEGFRSLCRRYLFNYRWQVLGAKSSDEARRILAEIPVSVILLDVMMPGEDGWMFLESLRKNVKTCSIPVLVCSVLNEPQLAQALGATTYLTKPVTQQALLKALAPWSQGYASQAIVHSA